MDFPNVVQVHKECASKLAESAPSASTNTGSPKLPPDVEEFMAYMVDHCERELITEEYIVQVGSDYLKWRQLRAGA